MQRLKLYDKKKIIERNIENEMCISNVCVWFNSLSVHIFDASVFDLFS